MLSTAFQPHQRRFDFARRTVPAELELPAAGWVRREDAVMGTSVRIELWADDPRSGAAACGAVMDEMHRIDRQMNPRKPGSELARINREAALRAVPLSEEMYRLIARAIELSQLSGGAFDIGESVVEPLDARRTPRGPQASSPGAERVVAGWKQLGLDRHARTLRFQQRALRVDLGGLAQGHAVDQAAAILCRRGIQHAFVSIGGQGRAIGDRRGRPWSLAIHDPRRTGEVTALLPLEDLAFTTSGSWGLGAEELAVGGAVERPRRVDDGPTGSAPAALRSVTTLGVDGLTSAALLRSVLVLGVERGLALIDGLAESLPGVDAVIVDAHGRLHTAAGLRRKRGADEAAPLACAA